jgi:pimeloyl-ACP methyl ester carboxylesterase
MTGTAVPATPTAQHLAVTDAGTGEPALLLVPGWCGDRSVFDALVAGAAPHRRAVSVDLPAHGDSPDPGEFGTADVVDALVATLEHLGIERVVPVALSPGGGAPRELRRGLGAHAVPGVVLLDWMVLGTPPGFADALAGLRSPQWRAVSDGLRSMWTAGLDIPALSSYVDSMGRYGEAHWARAGREIAAGFAEHPVPLEALADLQPCPTLHLYAQPADEAVLAAQQDYARAHPWFEVHRLEARSHFPMFEVPEGMAERIEAFAAHLT